MLGQQTQSEQRKMQFDWVLRFSFAEEKQQVRKAILSCSLTESKEAFEEDSESEEEEEEWLDHMLGPVLRFK